MPGSCLGALFALAHRRVHRHVLLPGQAADGLHHLVRDRPAGLRGWAVVPVSLERQRLTDGIECPGGRTRSVPTMATGMTGIPDASASQPTPVRPRYRRPSGDLVP